MEMVEMTAQERAEFEAFKEAQRKKEEAVRRKADREAYAAIVDETLATVMPELQDISAKIAERKAAVMDAFKGALEMKAELFGIKEEQRTHTFTNSDSSIRITVGHYTLDGYRDTVEEGIAKVKNFIESLAKDEGSRALVKAVFRLLSRDNQGNLKASRVLQLRRMAEEDGNEDFLEGVRIIEESYLPTSSSMFIKAAVKNANGKWEYVPLGMTEA